MLCSCLMQLARVITKRSKHRHQVSWPYRHTTQELASAEQDSPEAVGRRLSKHFTTDCRDLVFKATAALRAATKLGIACPDGQIPLVESLVSSGAVTNEENSSKQEVSAVLETSRTTNSTIVVPSRQANLLYSCMQTTPATSAGDAQTSTAASSCSTTESGVDTQSASSPLATAVLASPEPEFAPYRLVGRAHSGWASGMNMFATITKVARPHHQPRTRPDSSSSCCQECGRFWRKTTW